MLKNHDLYQLVGKNTLITGASGGFGYGLVEAFKKNGQNITALGRDVSKLEKIKSMCSKTLSLDMKNSDEIKNFSKTCDVFDNIIISHGISGARPMRMLSTDFSLNVIQTNLLSTLDLLSNLLRSQKINSPGRIIFISSISAHMGASTAIPYAASKAGTEAAMRGLARDLLRKEITVNSIAPAAIETPIFEGYKTSDVLDEKNYPLGIGCVEDVANAALFLALKGSAYITGETIILNGGCTWLS